MTKEESTVKLAVNKSAAGDKERSGRRGHKKEKIKPPKKIIIRRLPPTMTEEEFLKQIDPLPAHDFYYFAAADWSLGFDATCRAYITLKNEDDVFLFRDRFDGYVFVDSKGAEYPAIVEFAPFQGMLKNKSRRSDNKVSTIEQEIHYQQFLAKLEKDREDAAKGGECKLEFTLDRKKEEKITSTPLLQYLANQKEKRREEAKKRTQEKRRQREEEKEKRRQAQQQQQQQVTKIISGQDASGGNKNASASGNKSASGKENMAGDKGVQGTTEERKNSRSKRREERNQRRREQYEARKRERERERQEGEQRPDAEAPSVKGENGGGDNKSANVEQSLGHNKQTDDNTKGQQGKESKRYSERREREREKNRNRKEKEREREKDKLKEKEKEKESNLKDCAAIVTATATANKESAEGFVAGSAVGETVVNETVLNFIRSAASAKEFVPKHKQQELKQQKQQEETKQSPEEQSKANDFNGGEDKRTQKQKAADEQRRIRNKDRPSIAIYQPKARLRLSEEREGSTQPVGSKSDLRSNPTSDCESVKREETRSSKKVSRYSERRAERRNNREKQIAACWDDTEQNPRELRKSKSCENENNTGSKDKNAIKETAQSGEC